MKKLEEHHTDVNNKKSVEKITDLSQNFREIRDTPNWKVVEVLAKENNIIKRKFKESVAISQEKKENLLNRKEERSDIWSAITTQITQTANYFFY